MDIFKNVLIQLIRLVLYASIGFAFNKGKLISPEMKPVLSKLSTLLFLPMLTLYSNINNCTVDSLRQLYPLVLYGAAVTAVVYLVCAKLICGRRFPKSYEGSVMEYAYSVPNSGSFLTPLSIALLGNMGYFQQSLFCLPISVFTYTWGTSKLIPEEQSGVKKSIFRRLLNPIVVCNILGILLGLAGAKNWLPTIVLDSVSFFGNCYVPFALMVLGYVFADCSLKDCIPNRETIFYTVVRMILLPIALLFLLHGIGAPREAAYFACALFCCPCGMNTMIFPISYGRDSSFITKTVIFTSCISIVTIPLIYALMNAVLQ